MSVLVHECFVVHISARKRDTSFLLFLLFSFFLRKMRSLYFPIAQSCAWTYTKRLHIQNTRGSRAIISFISATRFFASSLLLSFPSPPPFLFFFSLGSAVSFRRIYNVVAPCEVILFFLRSRISKKLPPHGDQLRSLPVCRQDTGASLSQYLVNTPNAIVESDAVTSKCRLSSKAMRAPPKTQSSSKS